MQKSPYSRLAQSKSHQARTRLPRRHGRNDAVYVCGLDLRIFKFNTVGGQDGESAKTQNNGGFHLETLRLSAAPKELSVGKSRLELREGDGEVVVVTAGASLAACS
ncbi:hypothetical protein Y032_0107g3822 [Ancylostoma ceylanicum]|uniref:Uncharacterized protein n=1 Tax=Ancylostoma ceylanicum TaxID=53326 RepID=A0A016TFT3_9BILA|nr:hypothetical protein Y032_0107g3822 [Ancylostoma ceylanicum]